MNDNTSISLNTIPAEPTMSDLLNLLKREIFLDLNCHHLATIQSFDPSVQTVTATINYTKTSFVLNEGTGKQGSYKPVQSNYPLLVDVPVIVIGGGKGNITFPINQGDQCLVLFNDRNIDNWFQSGQVGPVASSRAHSFSDGIALVGLNSLNTSISGYDVSRAVFQNGTTKIGLAEILILITNSNGKSLGTILGNLTQALSSLMTALNTAFALPAAIGSPLDPAWSASVSTIVTAISQANTDLGGLLE